MNVVTPETAFRIENPSLLALYVAWQEMRGERQFPNRRDVDPVRLKFILGRLILVDVIDDGADFRVRLHGSILANRIGFDMTGQLLSAHPLSDYRNAVAERFRNVVADRRPHYYHADRLLNGNLHRYDALVLPLSEDGESIDTLLAGQVFARPVGSKA
jgi:hypothetical protein